MVNKENIDKVIAFMEAGTLPWDVSDTNYCIIGQTYNCLGADGSVSHLLFGDDNEKRLECRTVYSLFMPTGYDAKDCNEIYPRERAIAQLKYLRDNGEVNWDATPVTGD
jgi:hypothetical protein